MGISGLLTALKSIQKPSHLRQFAGQTIGVDAYGWLHRGTVACSVELALGKPCTKHIEFAMHRVRMLIYFGVTPYLVFDGDNLPSKAKTETSRAERREESRKRGMELYKAGKLSKAYPEFQKSVDVTPYMARQLIEELKKINVQYVVAPYEADAQLAFLEQKGILDGILSEDSDLLVYGAKSLITKLDQHGDCIEIRRSDFASCRDLSLAGLTDADFRRMAILSGCDYLSNINKVGLKTAHSYIRKYKNIDKILQMLQFDQKFNVPLGYLEKFHEAERTFLHHRVFCPIEKKMVFFNPPENGRNADEMVYLGVSVEPEIAIGVACGDLDPMTKRQIISNIAAQSRSMPNLHRKPPFSSTQTLKPSKSIDTFFKSNRQPLAELDPNNLTPSPSQQRLLRQYNGVSWEARSTSSAPHPRNSSSNFIRSGQARSVERSAFLERAGTVSTFQPTKRSRLCSDVDISPSGRGSHSRFFTTPEPSPTIRRKGNTKKARRSDIEIYSDDSVAEILEELDREQRTKPPARSLERINSPDKQHHGDIQSPEVSSPLVHRTPPRRKGSVQNVVIRTSEEPEDFEDLTEQHDTRISLRNTFAYQSAKVQGRAFSTLGQRREANQNENGPKYDHALQRSQSSAQVEASRTSVSPELAASAGITFSDLHPSRQAAALQALGPPQSSVERVKLGQEALAATLPGKPSSPSLTTLEKIGQQALRNSLIPQPRALPGSYTRSVIKPAGKVKPVSTPPSDPIQGSEDLLVPNSEDDASELSEPEPEPVLPRRAGINLSKFTFVPR